MSRTSITLDGNAYSVFQNKYSHVQTKIQSSERTLTGDLSRTEAGIFVNEYKMTLLCTLTDLANLRASYAKVSTSGTPPTNKLDFVDAEGTEWNPNSSGTGNLNTGVYFDGVLKPVTLTAAGWAANNRFTVDIQLTAISKNISS